MENNKEILEKIIREKIITINDLEGKSKKLIPIFFTYKVPDMLGKQALIPALGFMSFENGVQEPYGILTKSFGEFIGLKNCAYIDTNNYSESYDETMSLYQEDEIEETEDIKMDT